MTTMSDINDTARTNRENARDTTTGQFGEQAHTTPEASLAAPPTVEDTVYSVYENGELVIVGERGAGMSDILHRAYVHLNRNNDKPVITIRAESFDGAVEPVDIALPYADQGRIVGWYQGDAITAEEMDERDVSLCELDSVSVEPYIDLGRYNEGELHNVEKWARDAGYYLSNIYAHRDEETGGRHVDIALNENFLWNADTQCPDDEYDDDSDLDEYDERPASVQRYEKWLDENRDIVEEVYLEWFNADLDVPDTWETATVTRRKTVPYERFTESLVMEDIYPLLAKHQNETDPGTFMSPYVMGEVRRRAEKRQAEAERQLELSSP